MKSFPDNDTIATSPPARMEVRDLPARPAGPVGAPGAGQFPGVPPEAPLVAKRRRRGPIWILLALLLLLLAAGGWYYWKQWLPAQEARTGAATGAGARPNEGGATAPGGSPGTSAGRPGGGRGGPEAARTPVVAVAAQAGDVPITLDALGTVAPTQTVSVRSRVAGLLERVLFREGDLVKEGQLLAEIDPRGLKVQLAQAKGNSPATARCWRTRGST